MDGCVDERQHGRELHDPRGEVARMGAKVKSVEWREADVELTHQAAAWVGWREGGKKGGDTTCWRRRGARQRLTSSDHAQDMGKLGAQDETKTSRAALRG